jgi:hypothetical protein
VKTWQLELATVAAILVGAVVLSGKGWIEYLGAAAVLASFGHAQVADRMVERQEIESRFTANMLGNGGSATFVHCYRWSLRYFIAKEALWLGYFVAHRSWSALVGVGVFLAYPLWRKLYREAMANA